MGIEHVPVPPVSPRRLAGVLREPQAQELMQTIARGRALCEHRVVWSVNSTARGGGVAEMLTSLLAYVRGAGIDARWVVIGGEPAFFDVTKRIHNMLHDSPGDGLGLVEADVERYRRTAEADAAELAELVRPGDFVLLHDPQTAGLVEPLRHVGAHVVWRCHIGVDGPGELARAAWDFLLPHVREADALVFSRAHFVWEGVDRERVTVIPPSIDVFSPKNQELAPAAVDSILRTTGLVPDGRHGEPDFTRLDGTPGRVDRRAEAIASAPIPVDARTVLQVSRWDRLKDPLGVLEACCEHLLGRTDAHLVLAGPASGAVADDPEAADALAEVTAAVAACPAELRERVHLFNLPMDDVEENAAIVNALQRRADVVVQKSFAEGFGLTVAEGMWKGRPVVASRVGGIRDQIVDGESGVLVDPHDGPAFAEAVLGLLDDERRAAAIGARAREQVRELFLGPRHLRQYVELFERLVREDPRRPGAH
jgi:trehalose synthase